MSVLLSILIHILWIHRVCVATNTFIWTDNMENVEMTGWKGAHSGQNGKTLRLNGGNDIYRTTDASNYSSIYVVCSIDPWFDESSIDEGEHIHLQYQMDGILGIWIDAKTWKPDQLPTTNDVTYLPSNTDNNTALTIRFWNDGDNSWSDRVFIQEVTLGYGEYIDPDELSKAGGYAAWAIVLLLYCFLPCIVFMIINIIKRRRKKQKMLRQREAMRIHREKLAVEKRREDVDEIEMQKARNRAAAERERKAMESVHVETVENVDVDIQTTRNTIENENDGMIGKQGTLSYSAAQCVICLDILLLDETCTLQCGHKFHTHCIEEYHDTKCECPLCRKKIVFN